MLISNFPTFSYITWQGLIIVSQDETPYVINDGNTNCKYVYWEKANPYTLKATNDKLSTSESRFLIYLCDNGIGTEVPQDSIGIQYREGGGVLLNKIQGQFNELDGKYYSIKEDIEGIEKIIGSSEESEDGSIIDRINKVEQTAEGTKETIEQVKTNYDKDKEDERLREYLLGSLIALATALSEYQNEVTNASEDFDITDEERLAITNQQTNFIEKMETLLAWHDQFIIKIDRDENREAIALLNSAKTSLEMAINNLNTNVSTSLSDYTVVPSEITTMLTMFATTGVELEDYKNTLNDMMVLGVGGEVVTNVLVTNKTATQFKQTMSEIEEVIDGETGLKKQIEKNATNIEQTSRDLKLNYVKYDQTTAELTVSDNQIKLDAGKVLMTGTLTWESLDDSARENLKGEDGQDGDARYIMLTGDQFIKCDTNGVPNKATITIDTLISGINDTASIVWKYKQENSGVWNNITSNNGKTFYTLSSTSDIWGGKDSITIRAIISSTYYDDLTIVKVRDGIDGSLAEYVELIGEQSFKYTILDGETDFTPNPTVIVLEGFAYNLNMSSSRWYYKLPGQTGWTLMTNYNGRNTISVFPDDPILFANGDIVQIKFEINTHYDTITINKVYDGKDSVMAILSNETHVIPYNSNGTVISLEGASTNLSIYVGSIDDTANWSTTIALTGLKGTASNNNKTFTVTELTSDVGYVDFVSRKNNFDTITKRFTISRLKYGETATSYWMTSSASAIIIKENNTYNPTMLTLNAKYKEGTKNVADYKGKFKIYELVDDNWVQKYASANIENTCDYKISNSNNIKIELYTDNDKLIDEEYIPTVLEGTISTLGFLDNDSHIIPCNTEGKPLSYEGATTSMLVYIGSKDDTSNWKYTISETNLVGTLTGNKYVVEEIKSDVGYVDITAKKEGHEDITRRFSVSKAKQGETAKYVYITGDQVFKYEDNFVGTPTPESITLQATRNNITSNGEWYYKGANGIYVAMNITTDTITITPSMGLLGIQNTSTFRYVAEGYYDEITIIKIADGSNGLPGSDGEDGTYILVTNESHIVPCDSNGMFSDEELNRISTEVHVYKGIEEVDASIELTSVGCQATYNTAKKTVNVISLTDDVATVTIEITIDEKTFTKIMTIVKSIAGQNGAGIYIRGKIASADDLPMKTNDSGINVPDGVTGDAWLVGEKLYIYSLDSWVETDISNFATQGLPGKNGIDGQTTYLHIKYSNDGKTFTENNGETVGDWIGQYVDFYEDDSTNFADYKWKKIKGEDGLDGIVVTLTNDTHIIPYSDETNEFMFTGCSSKISLFLGAEELINGVTYSYRASENIGGEWDGGTGTYKVVEITNGATGGYVDLTAYYNGISYTKRFTFTKNSESPITINLSNDNHSFVANSSGVVENKQTTTIEVSAYKGIVRQDVEIGGLPNVSGLKLTKGGLPENKHIVTIETTTTSQLAQSGEIDIPITVNGTSYTKTFTYTRVDCGEDGVDGLDGYTVYLTNENHSFYCESNGSILEEQATTTIVKAFYGSEEKTPTIGVITTPSGLTITKSGSTIAIKTDGRTLADNGSFNIPITIDGRNFVKVFSWVKAYKGKDGTNGESAKYVVVSGEQVFRYPKGSTTPTPSSIILSVSRFNTGSTKGKWQYKASNGDWVDLGSTADTVTITPSSGTLKDNGSCTFRYILDTYSDEITIVEVSDGLDGNSGQTLYTWIKYADDASGKNISDDPNGKKYIGFSYNNTSATESNDPTRYSWTLIKGADGAVGAKGENGQTFYTWIKYSDNADGSSMYDTPRTTTQYIGIATNKLSATESTNTSDYTWSKFKGDTGVAGKDAYSIILTNENHSFVAENNGNIISAITVTCQVLAYKGSTKVTPTIGTITNPSGMTITKSGTTLTIVANTGTSLASSGTVTIPVTIDGITFNKIFSWTKSLKGANGTNGKDGSDASVPNWVKEWDGTVTTINSTSVVTPKIFAGTVTSGKPTGVAMGKDVFGTNTSYPVNGIVGYKNGVKTYEFNTDGTVLIGSKSGQYISWDGANLELNVKAMRVVAKNVATSDDITSLSNEIATVETTANKINWLVKSGTSSSNVQLTDRVISLVSSSINLSGFVTFSNLSTSGQTTIDGGNIKSGTIRGITIISTASDSSPRAVMQGDGISFYSTSKQAGKISFDSNGEGTAESAKERFWIRSLNGYVLKLTSSGDMSFASSDEIFFQGNALRATCRLECQGINCKDVYSTGKITATTGLVSYGATSLSSSLTVAGTTTLNGTTNTKALNVNSTAKFASSVTMSSSLTVGSISSSGTIKTTGNFNGVGMSLSDNLSVSNNSWLKYLYVNGTWVSSDARLKTDIKYLDKDTQTLSITGYMSPNVNITRDDMHEFIENLPLASYRYKEDVEKGKDVTHYGFVVQDILYTKVGSELVGLIDDSKQIDDEDAYMGYSQEKYVTFICGALQKEIGLRKELEEQLRKEKEEHDKNEKELKDLVFSLLDEVNSLKSDVEKLKNDKN